MASIEEEIKQSRFKSEYHKVVVNILLTANTLYATNSRFLKKYGLSPEQYNVLRILRGQFPKNSSVLLLQERMLDKMSNASRLVDKLESKELLTRKQCPSDRRQVEILITEKGLNLLREIDLTFDKRNKRLDFLPEEKIKEINHYLDEIRKAFRDTENNG
jgi:DNA-binding MarR family transcriptional regulator